MISIGYLLETSDDNIPNEPGVYFVKVPEGFRVCFSEKTTALEFNNIGKNQLYSKFILEDKYQSLKDKSVLYIGRSNNLKRRIREFINAGFNKGKNHFGGRAVWQIENSKDLLIDYHVEDNAIAAKEKKKHLLKTYEKGNGFSPLANNLNKYK